MCEEVRIGDARKRALCTKKPERRIGGDGAFVRRKRSGGWEVTDRLSYAVGENSIDFSRIPYRLFPNTSVQTLGRRESNDLFVWENRLASSAEKSANVRRGDGISSQERVRSKAVKAKSDKWDGGVG